MSITVTLKWYEIQMAGFVGMMRQVNSLSRRQTNKIQNRDFGWHSDIEGACAELAVAKYLGLYWDGSCNTFHLPDVADIQVRHTQHEHGCLAVRKSDDPKGVYCLVTGTHPNYCLRGWLVGEDAQRDEFLRFRGTPGEVWFAPQAELWPMQEMLQGIRGGDR